MNNDLAKLREARTTLDRMKASRARVGEINPYPVIEVLFSTLARTAIQRSDRGILYTIITDETASSDKYTEIKNVSDVIESKWTEDNVKLIRTAFEVFAPSKLVVRRKGAEETYSTILKEFETRKITHLACPEVNSSDDSTIITWVKGRQKVQDIVYVSAHGTNSDSCAIVELSNKAIKHAVIESYDVKKFTLMVAGAIAGCPLNRSLDNIIFPNIIMVDDVEPAKGKFTMYNDDGVVRVKLAINSKTTYDSIWKEETRFIKIYEGMCIIKHDIQDTFKNYWLGLYINNYNNKMAFCNNVNKVYFKELAPDVLSEDYDNRIFIDIEANKRHIVTDGKDPDTMTETEILRYPTGGSVYLKGDVRLSNVMINLSLEISY